MYFRKVLALLKVLTWKPASHTLDFLELINYTSFTQVQISIKKEIAWLDPCVPSTFSINAKLKIAVRSLIFPRIFGWLNFGSTITGNEQFGLSYLLPICLDDCKGQNTTGVLIWSQKVHATRGNRFLIIPGQMFLPSRKPVSRIG